MPVWLRDTLTMAHANPRQCLWGGLSVALSKSPASPWPSPGLWGCACAPRGTSTAGGRGLPVTSWDTPGLSTPLPAAAGSPQHFAGSAVQLRAAGGHQRCGTVPYLTLVRETPALSPLSICFQLLIQETHVPSIYLEKNE